MLRVFPECKVDIEASHTYLERVAARVPIVGLPHMKLINTLSTTL